MKIVSANYFDRHSEYPWLIRDESEDLDKAVPSKTVVATGVSFRHSGKEIGFGCTIVAICETAQGHAVDVSEERDAGQPWQELRFLGSGFYVKQTSAHVPFCEVLHLGVDGSMYAFIGSTHPADKRVPEQIES